MLTYYGIEWPKVSVWQYCLKLQTVDKRAHVFVIAKHCSIVHVQVLLWLRVIMVVALTCIDNRII